MHFWGPRTGVYFTVAEYYPVAERIRHHPVWGPIQVLERTSVLQIPGLGYLGGDKGYEREQMLWSWL